MITDSDLANTDHELYRRQIASGEARCAVFRRTYDASIADVWNACTDPVRLRRWYAPVQGDLRLGGTFSQGDFGSGKSPAARRPTYSRSRSAAPIPPPTRSSCG